MTKREPPSLPGGVQGLGMGLPDLRTKKKGKQKVSGGSHVTEALDKLREQTREAVRGLETMNAQPGGDDFTKDPMMEDWVKQFEELAGGQVLCFAFSYELSLVFFWVCAECQVYIALFDRVFMQLELLVVCE